jgi:Ser/Thr protein kinase RdoA (MazF antagonist)
VLDESALLCEQVLSGWSGVLGSARVEFLPHDDAPDHASDVYAVVAQDGSEFVLKGYPSAQDPYSGRPGLAEQHRLLQHLHAVGVPVAASIPSDDGRPFVTGPERVYALTRRLRHDPTPPELCADPARTYRAIGAVIGQVHRGLASYPHPLITSEMDLATRTFDNVLPQIRAHPPAPQLTALTQALDPLQEWMHDSLSGLTRQRIHGDCHLGNILLAGGEVIGVLDLDLVAIAPPIYDLGYLLSGRVVWALEDPARIASRTTTLLQVIAPLLAGYQQEHGMEERMQAALVPTILAVELIFVDCHLRSGLTAFVDTSVNTFLWMAQHHDALCNAIEHS